MELTRALARHPGVARVELFTRLVAAPGISADYACEHEEIAPGTAIVRVAAGPPGYIRKEELWDHLDAFADNVLAWYQEQGCIPDLIHGHYADAGHVAARIANQLGIPMMFTGHSLGRVKRRRLLASGYDAARIEEEFNMSRRIEAEEFALATAGRVVTSTHQEIGEQYELYDHYQPERMRVVPPGTDLSRFHPPRKRTARVSAARGMAKELRRFLRKPDRPMILTIARADPRKNLEALVTAYGECPKLQRTANLVIVAGNRDDPADLDEAARQVIRDLLFAIDRHDLYGRVAYPKRHRPQDVPALYRLAAASGGVFVNPALTEPFGITLIEAAASGLPIVATEDGGPRDIIGNCDNGVLVDPLDTDAIASALLDSLRDREKWQRRSRHGVEGAHQHYSWSSHVDAYLSLARRLVDRSETVHDLAHGRRPMQHNDRALFSELDQTLIGSREGLPELIDALREHRRDAAFGIATGRRLDSALRVMRAHEIPRPDVLITSGGTSIHYAPSLTADTAWARHIDFRWHRDRVRQLLDDLPGLEMQPRAEQSHFKLSYYIDIARAPSVEEINSLLLQEEQAVNVVLSFGQFLDILPMRASRGLALRHVCAGWDIPLDRVLVAGASGADEDMLRGNPLAAVVTNPHAEELSQLVESERIHFCTGSFATGVLEAIRHYDFFGACRAPETQESDR